MMNGMIKRLAMAAALTVSALLFGAAERSVFTRVKVEVTLERPPVPSVSNTPRSQPRIVADPQWLVVRVTFHPQLPREGGPNYSTFIDGVKMSVQALFPLSRSSSDMYGMFKGEQTFWTVCCDGKTHAAMMFVPPQLLQRYVYSADGYSGGHVLQRGSMRVEVIFTDAGGGELGRGYYGVPGHGSKQEEAFGRLAKRVATQFVIDGAIIEREATPWRCMAPEQFDLVKPEGVKIPEAPVPPRGSNLLRVPRQGGVRPGPVPPAKTKK